MNVKIIALYSSEFRQLRRRKGVVLRRRRDGHRWTQIECSLVSRNGRSFAAPIHEVPEDAPAPEFRAQIELKRAMIPTTGIAVVLRHREDQLASDPEQFVIAPILNTADRMIFEFGRGDVVFVAPTGRVEVRFVAVDRKTGEVGTRNEAVFHTRYTALAARCEEQIRGTSELFPLTPGAGGGVGLAIPVGKADLGFNEDITSEETINVGWAAEAVPLEGGAVAQPSVEASRV